MVAFITGRRAARSAATPSRWPRRAADIIAVDIAAQIDSVPYPMAAPEDLAETVKKVEALGRRIVAAQADVRERGFRRRHN
jgi:(+)-trans-carveol dehydrogenase